MYVRLSILFPKDGMEQELVDFFEREITPFISSAEGLLSSEVVISDSGKIVNREKWSSEADWEAHRDNLTNDSAKIAEFESLIATFVDEPASVPSGGDA